MIVEKGIEIPVTSSGRPRKYPFYDMEIGDSCFLKGKRITDMGSVLANVKGLKFSSRTVTENGKKIGVRVWRIA